MKLVGLAVALGVFSVACAASEDDGVPSSTEPVTAAPTPTTAVPAGSFRDLTFDRYHAQADIHAFLTSEAQQHPGLVSFASLGVSRQNREIAYIVVSNRDPVTVPAIYLNGTHHGDEWSSTEGILGLADYLIGHRDDADVKAILDAYAVYLQPLVNPDGHQAHTREDSQGNDPNRDYWYPGGTDAAAFKLPEIRLVRDLVDRIHPRAAAAYHSGIEEVLWPWCYTQAPSADDEMLEAIGKSTAEAMHFDRYLQSYDDYATTGEFIDYTYAKYDTVALTFEVSVDKTPSVASLDGVVRNSVRGALAFIQAVKASDAGAPAPARARVPLAGRGKLGAMGRRTTPRLE